MNLKPRGDFVVIKINTVDTVKGLVMPQNSLHGQSFEVVAIGPEVDDLNVGDTVLMTGQPGVDWSFIPNHDKHLIIKEGNVVLVFASE